MSMRILVVEDDEPLAQELQIALTTHHYCVDLATDGPTGLALAEAFDYGLLLLDWMLPKQDGISLCRHLRHQHIQTPILLLTAYSAGEKKIMGLNAGADDYMVKPFDLEELLARIRALLRRGNTALPPVLQCNGLRLDPSNCKVAYNTQALTLTSKEYALLEFFLRNPNQIFSQSALLDHLWSFDTPPSENAVRAQVKSLRKKLRNVGAEGFIETVHGVGYRLSVAPTELQVKIRQQVAASWKQHQAQYRDRIQFLEQTAQTLIETGTLDASTQQRSLREAHTLAGTLSSFGLTFAAHCATEIEQILLQERAEISRLPALVTALQQAIEAV